MTSFSKSKGYRIERYIVLKHIDAEVECKRVPASGAMGYFNKELTDDIVIQSRIGEIRGEVKGRKSDSGFKGIKKWLGDCPLLFIKEDHKEPLVVMTWDLYERLIK